MSGRRGRPGRNNNSESKYADEDYLNEYLRHRAEEEEEENNHNNGNNNNGNNWPENNYNYNLEYQEWRAQQEAAAEQPNNYYPNYYNEEEQERQAQQAARNVRRPENVNRALGKRLPANITRIISEFEGPVAERRVNIHPNFPGNPWEPNAFLPVPRNREVNPELPGNPWEANALPGRRHFFAAAPRPQATGRWRRKNRKTRRGSKNRKLRRSQRKNRK